MQAPKVFLSASVGLFIALGCTSLPVGAALIDRGGGLIYDTVLNLTWLQDSNYAATSGYQVPGRGVGDPMDDGRMDWGEAVTWAQGLSYFDSVRGVWWSDWRLPDVRPVGGGPTMVSGTTIDGSSDDGYNVSAPMSAYAGSTASALAYMYFNNLGNVARCQPTDSWSTCRDPVLPRLVDFNFGPFSNSRGVYWTGSNANVPFPNDAWAFEYVGPGYGYQGATNSVGYLGRAYAWAVMDGDVAALAPVPEVGTSALMAAGLALLGLAMRLKRQR